MQLDDKTFVVNSPPSCLAFQKRVEQLLNEEKYITFTWRVGEKRSLDQNALFHLWSTQYAAHLLEKDRKQVTRAELASMKLTIKRHYYAETGEDFMVHEVKDMFRGKTKLDYTSSADWTRGEAFRVMSWLQMKAAGDGLVLESLGEYKALQEAA